MKKRLRKRNSSPSMSKQYFVANNLLGAWGSMQMTVMSEGLLLNLKYIKMSREERGFQAWLTQLPETLSPPYISSPSLTYRRLVIFENTIFQLNSLNITVFVCHVSGSKVNRKERSRPFCLFVFLFHLAKYIIISEHLVPSCQCPVWGLKRV